MSSGRYFYPILTKFGASEQIFMQILNIIFYEGPTGDSRAGTDGQTDVTKVIGEFFRHSADLL
jgi:hypothetical protein